jgi:outer membrane PBP1 activator LpoA protein
MNRKLSSDNAVRRNNATMALFLLSAMALDAWMLLPNLNQLP